MNLRVKTLGVLIAALLAITAVTYAVADNIVSGGFGSIERDEAAQNLDRTQQALAVELNRLDSTAADWSTWDDTYAFAQDGNEEYIAANLYDATLVNLRVDSMVFFDEGGNYIYAQAIDAEGVGVEPDEAVIDSLAASNGLFDFNDTEDSTTGIVTSQAGAMLAAARPIITSDGEGPIAGSLVVTRWVDERFVNELRDVTKLDITLSVASDAALAPGEWHVESVDSDTLSATTVLADVNGSPALTARVEMPRTIFAEGHKTLNYLLTSLLVIGIAFLVLVVLLLELTVLRPVHRLSSFVGSVGTQLTARAQDTGSDEIGHLGRSINQMLDTIERYSAALSQANSELQSEQARVEELNRSLEAKVAERTGELEMANSELRDRNRQLITAMKQATTDGLTGLKNHRSFQEDVRAAAEEGRGDQELAVFMADLDRFKEVNDIQGHQAGDRILTRVAELFREVLAEESVFRYGGDEFAMMTWVSSLEDAEQQAEKIRQRVCEELTASGVTVSIGIALYSGASSAEELVYHADAAMYGAKADGKNRVRVWTPGGVALPTSTSAV